MDGGAGFKVAIHYQVADAIFQIVLYGALQWTCTKLHIVALGGHKLLGLVAQVDVITYLLDALVESLQLYIDNALDGIQIQLVEGDNLVQSVQELRRELLRECLLHNVACILLVLVALHQSGLRRSAETYAMPKVLQLSCSGIRCHDNHRVAEIHQSSVTIRHASLVQYLQQQVEHVRVGFLNLVEQHNRVGVAAHTLSQLSALAVTHVSWRRTNQSRGVKALGIFAHVDTYQRIAAAKHKFGQLLGQISLTYTRRT